MTEPRGQLNNRSKPTEVTGAISGDDGPPSLFAELTSRLTSFFSRKNAEEAVTNIRTCAVEAPLPDAQVEHQPTLESLSMGEIDDPSFSIMNNVAGNDGRLPIVVPSPNEGLRPHTVFAEQMSFTVQDDVRQDNNEGPTHIHEEVTTEWESVPVGGLIDMLMHRRDGLGTRAIRVIKEKGCRTIADVLAVTDDEWLRCRGFGVNSLGVLQEVLSLFMSDNPGWQGRDVPQLTLNRVTGPSLGDELWYPREWIEFQELRAIYGREFFSNFPIWDFLDQLPDSPTGHLIADTLVKQGYRTIFDVMNTPFDTWLSFSRMNSHCVNILTVSIVDYLRAEFTQENGRNELATKSVPRVMKPNRHHTGVAVNQTQSQTARTSESQDQKKYDRRNRHEGDLLSGVDTSTWTQLQASISTELVEKLKPIPIDVLLQNLPNRRVNNLVRRTLQALSLETLYDVVLIDENQWLKQYQFGTKALAILTLGLTEVIERISNGDLVYVIPSVPHSEEKETSVTSTEQLVEIMTWLDVTERIRLILSARELEVVQLYHGHDGEPETLESIGHRLDITRERVRQIKAKAGRRVSGHLSNTEVAHAIYSLVNDDHRDNTAITPGELRKEITDGRVVPYEDRWLIDWFDHIYGVDWFTQGITRLGKIDAQFRLTGNIQQAATTWTLADYLEANAYCPLSVEEALEIARREQPLLTAHDLYLQLSGDPDIRIFSYGTLQIGHSSWNWFDPKRRREAHQVEWALRLIHTSATPTELAQAIRERLGDSTASAFSVADVCERNPDRYTHDSGRYGLVLWEKSQAYVEPLQEALSTGALSVSELAARISYHGQSEPDVELLLAALYTNPDVFRVMKPLTWALATPETTPIFDPTTLTFEDLLPNL